MIIFKKQLIPLAVMTRMKKNLKYTQWHESCTFLVAAVCTSSLFWNNVENTCNVRTDIKLKYLGKIWSLWCNFEIKQHVAGQSVQLRWTAGKCWSSSAPQCGWWHAVTFPCPAHYFCICLDHTQLTMFSSRSGRELQAMRQENKKW